MAEQHKPKDDPADDGVTSVARTDLFVKLARDKADGLDAAGYVFKPAAQTVAADATASPAARGAATRFLQ
jgi:hypothetical protein